MVASAFYKSVNTIIGTSKFYLFFFFAASSFKPNLTNFKFFTNLTILYFFILLLLKSKFKTY